MEKTSLFLVVVVVGLAQACAGTGWQQSMKSHEETSTAYRVRGKATADTSVVLSVHQTRALSRHLAVKDAEQKMRARLGEIRLRDGSALGKVAENYTTQQARLEALVKRATRIEVNWTSPHEAEVVLELTQADIDQLIDSYRMMADASDTS